MKNKFTAVLLLGALLGQSTSLFSQKHKLGTFQLDEMMHQEADANGKTKQQSIKEALEWRNNRLADENGNFDPNYYLNAVNRADQLHAANGAQRSATLQWEELGPGNVGGRTRALLYDKRDTTRRTIYAGAVGGGIWKTTNGGDNWTRLTSVKTNLAVSCIAQDANGLIYYGTGEGHSQPSATSRNSGTVGNGLHILDANDSDAVLPSTVPSYISNGVQWCEINRIAINPHDVNDIYAAISGGNSGGLMHSIDAGQTWSLIGNNANPIANLSSGFYAAGDVKFSSDGSYIFASVGTGSGIGIGGRFILSPDAGATWVAVPTGNFPQYPGAVVRIEIAVAPSNPNIVYVVVASGGSGTGAYVYKSADAGTTWTQIGSPGGVLNAPYGAGGQGWYDNIIAVSPFDADKLYLGGTQLYTYTSLSGWALASIYFGDPSIPQWVHADMHAIVFNDKNKNEMLVGCDGGVFKSSNAFDGFPTPDYTEKNRGYAVTQNYSVAADYYGNTLGGAQDNGTNYVNYLNGATTYSVNVYGGDGVYTEISHLDPNIFIGGYVNGNDYRSASKGSNWVTPFDGVIDPQGYVEPSICGQAKGAGNAPFVTSFWLVESKNAYNSIDSVTFVDNVTRYAGEVLTFNSRTKKQTFQVTLTDSIPAGDTVKFVDPIKAYLYFATSCGLWVTPDILDFTNTPRWFRVTLTTDDTKSLTATPTGDTIYFGGNSKMHRMIGMNSILAFDTAKKGHNDILLSSGTRFSDALVTVTGSGRYIEGMDVDRNDPTHVLATVAGYSTNGTPHVYHSFNSGATWSALGASTLPNMPVYDGVIDAYNPSHYIIGGELGVWDSYDNGATWTEQNAGIDARLPVYRLRQQNYLSENCYVLYIGTHGRGMWRSTTLTSASPDGCVVNALGINTPKNTINNMLVYPNPITSGVSKLVLEITEPTQATIRVIDMPGRLMQELSYSGLTSGRNELNLNTSNLSSGTYLVVATLANGQTMTRTISVVK